MFNIAKLRNLALKYISKDTHISYSQTGEDLIVEFIFNSLGIKEISYLDIGSNHPINYNNTYLFYIKGFHGVSVEPDPKLSFKYKKSRPRDTCLNFGVGPSSLPFSIFYQMENANLSTFSKNEAENTQKSGEGKIIGTLKIPLKDINSVIIENFKMTPNFISLDVEGLDKEIMKTFDFNSFRPEVFCIETITFSPTIGGGEKITEIFEIMKENGYEVFADTYINTIFVDGDKYTRK